MSELNWHEVEFAAIVGVRRRVEGLKRGRVDRHGFDPSQGWLADIEGAIAEMLVAKLTDRYWMPVADSLHDLEGDVGRVQVRTTPRDDGCLLLHPDDPDDAPFALVVGSVQTGTLRYAGWLYGGDGKDARWWRDNVRSPAFFVPQSALRGRKTVAA